MHEGSVYVKIKSLIWDFQLMKKPQRSTPRNYDGTASTGHSLKKLLPRVMGRIGAVYAERPDLILSAWPQVVGPQLAQMTRAVSFTHGKLVVKVNNSTLLSLFTKNEKARLLSKMKERFPEANIAMIDFRIG